MDPRCRVTNAAMFARRTMRLDRGLPSRGSLPFRVAMFARRTMRLDLDRSQNKGGPTGVAMFARRTMRFDYGQPFAPASGGAMAMFARRTMRLDSCLRVLVELSTCAWQCLRDEPCVSTSRSAARPSHGDAAVRLEVRSGWLTVEMFARRTLRLDEVDCTTTPLGVLHAAVFARRTLRLDGITRMAAHRCP